MKTLSLFMLFFICVATNAQKYELKNKPISDTTAAVEGITIHVDHMVFDLIKGKTGVYYQQRTSKNGNEYRFYFGYPTADEFKNQRVFTDKKGNYWIGGITRNGTLKKVFLTKN